jgi:peptidyl-tRNA hydrolase, PTH1 family
VVGLGNPDERYRGTRHNVGFEVAALAADRWQLPRAKKRYAGRYSEGRVRPGAARAGVMNESGRSAGPARGALGVPLERVVAVHDDIDLPFGDVRVRLGGGMGGHNGLKSLERGLGGADFQRVRVGVGRPESTDPELVSKYVLGRFREPPEEVEALLERAAEELERLVEAAP